MLTNAQLVKLNTKRLISLLKSVKVKYRRGLAGMSCECCGEYLGKNYDEDYAMCVMPHEKYAARIKKVLSTREHIVKKAG